MDKKDIHNAIKARINAAALGYSIAWPNVDHDGTVPRLEITFPAADRFGGTLKGAEITREIGTVLINAIAAGGAGEDAAADMVDAVVALFPEGLRLSITGGKVVITKPADIRGGYPDGGHWRLPVVVQYEATAD